MQRITLHGRELAYIEVGAADSSSGSSGKSSAAQPKPTLLLIHGVIFRSYLHS